ncbi:hypothetical protein I4U23_011283 [Adineta vaga]|nr:hypothetical protein I4U23_011283 [Adineta vaga]
MPHANLPFDIEVGQDDDGELVRAIFSTAKLKIYIRLYVTTQSLTFDDFSVDYFYASHTPPPKTLNSCDFKLSSSSCTNDLVSLSEYLYQWLILNTTDGVKVQTGAPSMDYTFRNASGHYALLPGPKNGYVGYLHLPKTTSNYIERIILLKFSVL